MSFLKEFKDDLAQAVNELVADDPTEEATVAKADKSNNQTKKTDNTKGKSNGNKKQQANADLVGTEDEEEMVNTLDEEMDGLDMDTINSMLDAVDENLASMDAEVKNQEVSEMSDDLNKVSNESENNSKIEDVKEIEEVEELEEVEEVFVENTMNSMAEEIFEGIPIADDEITEITKGTAVTGNIASTGSMNVYGKITGDIHVKGKLVVTGTVVGTSEAKEIFANNAKIEGDMISEGTVKIGNGSVIIGNVIAASAVIGGAIKGDIDVQGPVIVDGTAVIKGNIKSKSVQINNGAAIEGSISQCYAEIDYKSLFDDTFSK